MKRSLYLIIGLLSVGLGTLGVFLPLLPTVPFILLAAFCFARSSERLNLWLHQHPWFADGLNQWEAHRAMRPQLKRKAMLLSAVSFSISIYVVPVAWVKLLLLGMGVALLLFLWRIPVINTED